MRRCILISSVFSEALVVTFVQAETELSDYGSDRTSSITGRTVLGDVW
jgi:hypothetical protein